MAGNSRQKTRKGGEGKQNNKKARLLVPRDAPAMRLVFPYK